MTLRILHARKTGRALTHLSLAGLCAAAVTPALAGPTLTTLASFNGTNGNAPQSGVTFDSNGNLFGTTQQGGPSTVGTVFEIAKGSSLITNVASFTGSGSNGAIPLSDVTFDSSGNLFGTTENNGTYSKGTLYKIAKGSNTITTVISFNGTNGNAPSAGVVFDSAGTLYGTTNRGGPSDNGAIYAVIAGTSTIAVEDFFTTSTGTHPDSDLTFDSGGNLFGTAQTGGANGVGTVFEISKTTGILSAVASFNGANGGHPSAGVTFDSAGNLFGTAGDGGAFGYGVVYEIAKGSTTITDVASFNNTNGAFPGPAVTLDSAGDIFGTTTNGGASLYGTVFEIAKGANTITHLVSFTSMGSNGSLPYGGVTFDKNGNLFGTTSAGGSAGDGTVFEITGLGSSSAAPEPAQTTAVLLMGTGLGTLLFRAGKRRHTAATAA